VTRLKMYAAAVSVAALLAGILVNLYVLPAFMLLATPGVLFGLMAAGNTPDHNTVLIFLGNWFFYSLIFVALAEFARMFRRMRTR
jgi:hypothetical protein